MFSFLAEHRFELFPPGMFADLFPSTRGRPSVAPEIVASVLVLRALNGLSDRVAAVVPGGEDAVRCLGTATDYSKPGKPAIVWDDKPAREHPIDTLVRDALAIVAALTGPDR